MQLFKPDWDYVRERSEHFTGRTWVFDALQSFLDGPVGRFPITGLPGTGKTAIVAQLLQASDGDPSPSPEPRAASYAASLFPRGVVHAAYLCRAGQVDILDCAQRLYDQLCQAVDGFAATSQAFLTTQITAQDIHVQTGDVGAGASVAGVRIDLSALGPERAFTQGVTIPLRRLREKGFSGRIVLLIDALDEAMTSTTTRGLAQLLFDIEYAHVIITSRPDLEVIDQWRDSGQGIDLILDNPPKVDDLAEYVSARLAAMQDPTARETLKSRIVDAAKGNFLYALYVLDGLIKEMPIKDLKRADADQVELPTGGLAGVYRRFLQREPLAWSSHYYPVLAPLIVGQARGLNTDQLVPIAKHLSGENFTRTKVRQITRDISQFLEGQYPDGPFRPYHKSFADFLQDPKENPTFTIDAAEGHAAILETYLKKPREEWDEYAWRYLFFHAYEAGKGDATFQSLFDLTDDDYLADKLKQLGRFEDVSADYELLFEACSARQDVGRSARYALMRSSMTKRCSVVETPGLLGLLLADPDVEKTRSAFAEFRSVTELVFDPVHKAAVLINLYEQCPQWLAESEEGKAIQDAAGKLLSPLPKSNTREYQISRLAKAASVQRRDQMEWVETLIGALSPTNYLSEGWASLAQGYLRAGDEENSVRCLKETLRHLPSTAIFSVKQFFQACEGLKEPTSFHQLHQKALEVWQPATRPAEFFAVAGGLLARAGDEVQGLEQIESAFRLFGESQEDEWQRARLFSSVADVFGEFRDPASIAHLWAKYQTALKSLTGSAAERLASRLVIARAAHVRHGVSTAETALQDVASITPFELGDYGCRPELQQLIDACLKAKSLTALRVFAEKLDQMQPARDRARLSAQLIIAFDALGDTEAELKLRDEAEQAYFDSESRERIGGGVALAATPAQTNSEAGLFVDTDFVGLQTLNDTFDRTQGVNQILETLQTFPADSGAILLITRAIGEIQFMENRGRLLSAAAKTASASLPPLGQRQIADVICHALNAPKSSVGTIISMALAARAFHLGGNEDTAKQALQKSLLTYRLTIDERTKWFAARELARSCAQLEDRETLASLFEITRQFGAKDFTGRFYRQVADALPPEHFADLLEAEAEKLFGLVDGLSYEGSQAELLGNIARGLSRTFASEPNLKLLERIAETLDRIPPPPDMRYATEAEPMLSAWAHVSRTLAVWGFEQERFASMQNALQWWRRLAGLATPSDGWYLQIGAFAEALLSSADKVVRETYLQDAFDESRSSSILCLKLTQALCEATREEWAAGLTEEVVAVCRQRLDQGYHPEQFASFYARSSELIYSEVLALAALAAAHDRCSQNAGTDLFLKALGLAEQIDSSQMQAWSYGALLANCSSSSPARTQIEQDAIRLLPTLGEMSERSAIAIAWLKTTKIKDDSRAMELFKYVKSDATGTIIAFMKNGDDFSKMSALALRAASLFSEEDVLYVSASVALEQAKRTGKIDETLMSRLTAALEISTS